MTTEAITNSLALEKRTYLILPGLTSIPCDLVEEKQCGLLIT